MGNCNAPGYFLQATYVESIDTGIARRSNLFHKENYKNNCIFSKLWSHYSVSNCRKTVLFFCNTVLELPVSDWSEAAKNQAPRYHAKLNFYLMVSMPTALLRAINTTKNTIDDADYTINWIIFIVINRHVINSRHSHSIVAGGLLEMS